MAGATPRTLDLPLVLWLVPLGTSVAAVVAWTVWYESPTAAWIGAAFIVGTGLLTGSLVLEALPHRAGVRGHLRRFAIAAAAAFVTGSVTFIAAAIGLYLRAPFF